MIENVENLEHLERQNYIFIIANAEKLKCQAQLFKLETNRYLFLFLTYKIFYTFMLNPDISYVENVFNFLLF